MRVNHSGEICAQALYQGQALTANSREVRQRFKNAAAEEVDHLAWTRQRLDELATRPSILNPIWYFGSVLIGAAAGKFGDKWSLGFVAETEHQVVEHLNHHLQRLPQNDIKSKKVLAQMREDEGKHATVALEAGAVPLPNHVRRLMRLTSQVMTKTSFWI